MICRFLVSKGHSISSLVFVDLLSFAMTCNLFGRISIFPEDGAWLMVDGVGKAGQGVDSG